MTITERSSAISMAESSEIVDQQMDTKENGWKPVARLLAVNICGAAALHFGEPAIQQHVQEILGGATSTEDYIRIARNIYGGVALGLMAGATLSSGDRLPNRFAKRVASTATFLGLAGLGAWTINKFGTHMGEQGSLESTAQKAVLTGAYIGGRNFAQSHPYGDTRHPGLSSSPVARSIWYYPQLAKERFYR